MGTVNELRAFWRVNAPRDAFNRDTDPISNAIDELHDARVNIPRLEADAAQLKGELARLRDAVAWLVDIHVDAREQQRRYLAFFAEAHAKVDGKWIDPATALLAAHEESKKQ